MKNIKKFFKKIFYSPLEDWSEFEKMERIGLTPDFPGLIGFAENQFTERENRKKFLPDYMAADFIIEEKDISLRQINCNQLS